MPRNMTRSKFFGAMRSKAGRYTGITRDDTKLASAPGGIPHILRAALAEYPQLGGQIAQSSAQPFLEYGVIERHRKCLWHGHPLLH